MSKSYADRLMDRVSDIHQRSDSFVVLGTDIGEDIDFCLNKCPHENKPCNGDCEEYKNFAKQYKGGKK